MAEAAGDSSWHNIDSCIGQCNLDMPWEGEVGGSNHSGLESEKLNIEKQ